MAMKTILVVDDNETNRALLNDILSFHKYRTVTATDGEEAIKMADEHLPNLVLMDMKLPCIDGLEATRMLRNAPRTQHIPVIAISGEGSNVGRGPAMEAGCCDYISKPIDVDTFVAHIEKHLP